jgi:hypothetical protein
MTDAELDQELAAIRERCDAATSGPWTTDGSWVFFDTGPGGRNPHEVPIARLAHTYWDARFIASARSDIPVLLTEVVCLRSERDAARKATDQVMIDARGEVVELRAALESKEKQETEHFKTLSAFDPWRGEQGETP